MGQEKMEGNRLCIKFVTAPLLGLTEDECLSEPVESACVAAFADCSPAITNGGYVRGVRRPERRLLLGIRLM
jgi:hypothetical protein